MLPGLRAARKAVFQRQRTNNMKQIGLALRNYNDANRCLPPATLRDSQGRLTISWRWRILPYVEATPFYTYAIGRRWSDAYAFAMLFHPPYVFFDPAGDAPRSCSETTVLAITGPGTAFDDGQCLPVQDLDRDTILAIECWDSGAYWTEPRDLDIDDIRESIVTGLDGDGLHVLFADGTVWFLNNKVPLEALKKFFTVEGARRFDREQVLGPYAFR